MKKISYYLSITLGLLLGVLVLPSANALETTSNAAVDQQNDSSTKNVNSSLGAHNSSYISSANTSVTNSSNNIANVETCNAQSKLWNGSACVSPAVNNTISTTAIIGESFYVYSTQVSVPMTGSSSCCEWYFTPSCPCVGGDPIQNPTVVKYGSMYIVEPHICVARGPFYHTSGDGSGAIHVGKGDPNPGLTAYNIAKASYCYPVN